LPLRFLVARPPTSLEPRARPFLHSMGARRDRDDEHRARTLPNFRTSYEVTTRGSIVLLNSCRCIKQVFIVFIHCLWRFYKDREEIGTTVKVSPFCIESSERADCYDRRRESACQNDLFVIFSAWERGVFPRFAKRCSFENKI
jgi:hypothetical protein